MIQKLRRRFIAATMLSLALVLLVILGTVNIVSYCKTVADADGILALLSENQGAFPMHMFPGREPPQSRGRDQRHFSPETPFESRFFSVLLNPDGGASLVDTANIAAIDAQTAENYANQVVSSGKKSGFLGDYRFLAADQRVIFLDCGRSLAGIKTTLLASFGVAAAGLGAVFVLLLFLSDRIVKPVAESYAKQRQFITDAGHELKTPLTVINADADLLELECGENEWLEDIRRQTSRLAGLTNDLVYLSRMDEEKPAVTMVDFPMSDVVEEAAQTFLAPATQQGKKLVTEIEPMLSLLGSEKDIRQLVSILLDNALKYSIPESEITLQLFRDSRHICLAVTNTASYPLEQEKLPRMFDRFFRMDSSRNSSTGGYGLGLAIAKGIVSSHRGHLRASTPDGKLLRMEALFPNTECK